MIKTIFTGILLTEVWYFSLEFASNITSQIVPLNYENYAIFIGIVGLILVLFYLFIRGFLSDLRKIVRSLRFDVFFALLLGITFSVTWGGLLINLYKEVLDFSLIQNLIILGSPFFIYLLVILKSISGIVEKPNSGFLLDREISNRKDDLLNLSEKADGFAERVFNNGSPDSFVFGVDSPWGIGKSSFINFCEGYWDEKYQDRTIIYKFNPLKYVGNRDLLEIFVNGLIHSIQKDSFIPEIRPLISKYSRLLRESKRFSIFGIQIPTFSVDYTAEEAFDDLTVVLEKFDKKIIIVVDDLDRMSFSEIKDILFVIRKSLILPNISYVLCYDTENIGILEAETPDIEKVSEFLEKFVNIKISLFLDKTDLSKYVSNNLNKVINNKLVDPILVSQAIGGLKDIYDSSEYHNYLPFVGDVRKLKRLINTVVLFEVESTDFKNSDFDKKDLIHLLLIYIHYPNIFRKIYDTETQGGRGFFSAVIPYDDGYPENENKGGSFTDSIYKNSVDYIKYLEKFSEDSHQRFLLEKVFNIEQRLESTKIDNVPEIVRTSYACFNGGWNNGRNLESYLNLIIHLSKPTDTEQHNFYENWKNEIISEEQSIESAISHPKFSLDDGEFASEKLWRIIVNNARNLPKNIADHIIKYLIEILPKYSHLEIEGISLGLRKNTDRFLIRLLNDAGWQDDKGAYSGNTEENIKEISEWIFGEGSHSDFSVIEKLTEVSRGILGLYDLMAFRLYCSSDRGGDIFNLTRSLSKYGSEDAPTEGNTAVIAKEEMRIISQKIFALFKKRYINQNKNIFDEIEGLTLEDFASESKNFIDKKVSDGTITSEQVQDRVAIQKSITAGFIIYELTNNFISSGVGCGIYDETGDSDSHGIKLIMNEYLFDVCFNPETSSENAQYFIDYLLRNFASIFGSGSGRDYVPSINEFTKILDEEKLADFWKTHGDTIKGLNLKNSGKMVQAGNYIATYKEDIEPVYKILDDHLAKIEDRRDQCQETD